MITIKHLTKTFSDTIIFDDVNLKMDACGMHIIEGPSGSGKSTFLNILLGFEKIDSGEVTVDATPVMIFQNYELFDNLTVKDNILLGRDNDYLNEQLINYFGMTDYLSLTPKELSGGQKQRVGILRSLILNPSLILCDEPTESLDVANKILVMELLKKISKHSVVIIVTHDHDLAKQYGDYFYRVEDNDIRLVKSGTTDRCVDRKTLDDFKSRYIDHIFKLLFLKRDFIFYLLHSLFLIILGVAVIFVSSWLSLPKVSNSILNDYIYIETRDFDDFDPHKYSLYNYDYRVTYVFQSAYYNGFYYDVDIFPYPSNINGLYLNDSAAKIMDIDLNDELTLYYIVDGKEFPFVSKVTGFIDNRDINAPLICYSLADFHAFIKNIKYDDDGQLYDESIMQYDYLLDRMPLIEYHISYSDQESIYNKSLRDNSILVHAPLLEERVEFLNDTSIFRIVYSIFIFFLFVSVILLHFTYLNRSIKKAKINFAILVSQGVDLKYLKYLYSRYKSIAMILSSLLASFIIILLSCFFSVETNILLVLIFIINIYALFMVTKVLFSVATIKIPMMSKILKDNAD